MKAGVKKILLGELSIKRLLSSMILVPLLIYILCAAGAYLFSERIIFQPQKSSYHDDQEIIKPTSKDGTKISAIYLPNPKAEYTILYSHGNAEDLGDGLNDIEMMNRLGFAVFAYDYHGYGTSP